jgi:hypothetical protein
MKVVPSYNYSPSIVTPDPQGNLQIGAQDVPVPTHISPEARAAIATAWAQPYVAAPPQDASRADWDSFAAAIEGAFVPVVKLILDSAAATVDEQMIDGVQVFRGTANAIPAKRRGKVLLYAHGGSFVLLSGGNYAKALAALFADQSQCLTLLRQFQNTACLSFSRGARRHCGGLQTPAEDGKGRRHRDHGHVFRREHRGRRHAQDPGWRTTDARHGHPGLAGDRARGCGRLDGDQQVPGHHIPR